MKSFNPTIYIGKMRDHYENFFGLQGSLRKLQVGPTEKLHSDFYILEIPPNKKHSMWTYCTVGMSVDRLDENLIELFVYSAEQDESLVELMTVCASYHRNKLPLGLHHTVFIGRSWQDNSLCDHGFISQAYLDGEELEFFYFENEIIHCYWFIPITEKEVFFKEKNGCEALEQLFEEKQLDYLNPNRESLV